MFCFDCDPNATPDVKFATHQAPMGIQHRDQVIQYLVNDVLVENPFVPERPDVKFKGLRLDDLLVRHIADTNRCKIRLTGRRTNTGKFIRFELHQVISAGRMIGESF